MGNVINIIDLGLTSYRETWQLQLDAVGCVQAGAQERVYLTEHRPVYTLGKHGHAENMLRLPAGAECIRIERGGDITYHGPGQLVVYPIISLRSHSLGVKQYVDLLEETVIRVIARFGIKGERVDGATGVWIDVGTPRERKICAIGVKVSHAVTMHGFALNVNTDLRGFSAINPCGFVDKGVTSIAAEVGGAVDMQVVKDYISETLMSLLN